MVAAESEGVLASLKYHEALREILIEKGVNPDKLKWYKVFLLPGRCRIDFENDDFCQIGPAMRSIALDFAIRVAAF